jgi:hypothetical protein
MGMGGSLPTQWIAKNVPVLARAYEASWGASQAECAGRT